MMPTEKIAPQVGDIWYRYEERRYGVVNEFDDVVSSYVQLQLIELKVTRVTPKGVWVTEFMNPRFVLASANKRFALPTKGEALTSLIARKARQLQILESQMKNARDAQQLAQRELLKLVPPDPAQRPSGLGLDCLPTGMPATLTTTNTL